jgi:hypothetical protein
MVHIINSMFYKVKWHYNRSHHRNFWVILLLKLGKNKAGRWVSLELHGANKDLMIMDWSKTNIGYNVRKQAFLFSLSLSHLIKDDTVA